MKNIFFNRYLDIYQDFLLSFIIKIIGIILLFGSQVYLANILNIKSYGYLNICISIFFLVSLFSKFGLETLSLKYVPIFLGKKKYKQIKGFFFSVLKVNIKIYLLLLSVFIVFLLNDFIDIEYELKISLIIFILSIPLSILSIIIYSYFRSYKYIFDSQFIDQVIRPILIITFSYIYSTNYLDINLIGISFIYLMTTTICLGISGQIFYIKIFKKLKKYKYIKINSIVKEGSPIFFSILFFLLITQSDILMLGLLSGAESVGIYSPASKLSSLIYFVTSIFSTVLSPLIASAYNNADFTKIRNITQYVTRRSFVLSIIILVFFVNFGEMILSFYGENFVVAYIPLLIISLGHLTRSISISEDFMFMSNLQGYSMKICFFAFILNIFLNYYLIIYYGVVGASIATFISLLIINFGMPLIIYFKINLNTTIFKL